jgi:hypothetical protein
MASSASFSACRVEPGPDRLGAALLSAGAALAAVALWLSALPAAAALGIWLLAVVAAGLQWRQRRRRPQAIALYPDSTLRLEWNEQPARDARLHRWRRLGPLLVLELEFDDGPLRRRRIDLWLPGLNNRRELLRQLARMHPGGDASV